MIFKRFSGLLICVLLATPASAEELYVQLFFDEAPLKGAEIKLDDISLGATGATGGLDALIEAGDHTLLILEKGGRQAFPVAISVADGDTVELSVTFTSGEGGPLVSLNTFALGEQGEPAVLTGVVRDQSGEPVSAARVAAGGKVDITGIDGVYQLEVPRGTYSLSISAEGYKPVQTPKFRALAGLGVASSVALVAQEQQALVEMEGPSLAMEEVVVMGVFKAQENAADLQRYATSIINAIDVEMLERFGDSDVAAALVRVSGVSIQDSKYATVRGLDGRYISTNLNGLLMPSTDPSRRDIQLDLFPTNILGGIEITKAFTPDQLASTTGGSIKIKTKGLPDEFAIGISTGVGYISDVTGEDVIHHQGSNGDAFGYDDGRRDLLDWVVDVTEGGTRLTVCDPGIPKNLCVDQIIAAGVGVAFEDDYNTRLKKAVPSGSLSLNIGDRLPTGDGEWGYYLAGNYSYENTNRNNAVLTDPIGAQGAYERAQETIQTSGYGVIGYEWGEENEVLLRGTVLRSTGITTRHDVYFDSNEDIDRDRTILDFEERQFASLSLNQKSEILGGLLDFGVAYSQTDVDQPDRRTYEYYNGNLSFSSFERRWFELTEQSADTYVDWTFPIEWSGALYSDLKVGALYSDKNRDVTQYRFSIGRGKWVDDVPVDLSRDLETEVFSYANMAIDAFRIRPSTSPTDSYDSAEETISYYLSLNTEWGDSLSFLLGARYEEFTQEIAYPNSVTDASQLKVDDFYPAANITWRPTDEWQLRLAYSKTVSYPGLIERTDATSYNPITDDPVFGNPNLIATEIDNIDARIEYYFSDTSSVTLSVFYKDILNPIEQALPDASGSAAQGITFRNQKSAELTGVELEGSVDLIDNGDWLAFLSGNVSYIDSSVELGDYSRRLEGEGSNGRQLQGQSEYLANIQLGVDHYPTEQKFTLLVNYFDDRIFRIARGAATGPEIEVGRVLLDLSYEKQFTEALGLSFQVKNLLNDKVEFSQNARSIESWENGISLMLKLKYEFR